MYEAKTMCECCGIKDATVAYSEPDESGHLWQHCVCERCHGACSSDENGTPVHMSPEWDGTAAKFDACRCTPAN